MIWYAAAGLLVVAAATAHAAVEPQISPVASVSPVVLTVQVTVDGVPYEVRPLYYPPDASEPIMGTGARGTGGPGSIVLAEINGTVRDTMSSVGDPLAVILYGEVAPGGDWAPPVPVVYAPDAEPLIDALDGEANVVLSYDRTIFHLEEVSDIATMTVGDVAFAIAVGRDAIQVMDVSDPERLAAVASLPYEGWDVEVIPDTTYAMVAHPDGVRILDMSVPYRPSIAATINDDQDGYDMLGGVSDIETVSISGSHFAVITAFGDDGVQIVDVTDPANPAPVASVTDEEDGYEALDGARGVDIATIHGRTYAVVASYDSDAIQVIDIVNPFLPLPVSTFDGDGEDDVTLDGATDIVVINDDDEAYALVTSYNDDAIQIVNVTTPAVPTKIRSLADETGRFNAMAGATDIDVVTIGSTTYGLISAYNDDAIQVIDLNNPSLPRAVGDTLDDEDLDFYLDGVRGMDTVAVQGTTYLLAAASVGDTVQVISLNRPGSPIPIDDVSRPKDIDAAWEGSTGMDTFGRDGRTYAAITSYADDALQLVDVTNPRLPLPVSTVYDETGLFESLGGATDVEVVTISGGSYAVVAAYEDDAVQIINVTDPASPQFVAEIIDGEDGFESLGGPVDVDVASISGRTYAVVAAYEDDAVQIIDLIDPRFPVPASDVRRGEVFAADDDPGEVDAIEIKIMDGPRGLVVADIFGKSYCMVVGQNDDTLLILDVTNPAQPWPVAIIYDDLRGYTALNGAADVEVLDRVGHIYALVAGKWDGGVQILEVTDPANPEPVAAVFDNRNGFSALNGAADIELVVVFDRMVAVVSSAFDDGLQLIDVTDPANPIPVRAVYDGSGGYEALDGADDVEIFATADGTHVLVAGVAEGAVQIAKITP